MAIPGIVTYPNPRGSYAEHVKALKEFRDFTYAMRRQDPDFWVHRADVDAHLKATRAFQGVPYNGWLRVLQSAWEQVLSSKLTGLKADMVIIDDPINQETPVKTKKQPKPKAKTYNTCAVRFLRGHNLQKVYTYRVPKKVKLHLGEEVVVPSLFDGFESNSIAVVVELHSTPQDTEGYDYKFITGRITRVKAA